MKLDREIVHNLKNTGMTFQDIADMKGVSRQYIWNLYTGYDNIYKKTEKYKMYKRHYLRHSATTRLIKPCNYCVNENNVNILPLAVS